MVKTGGKGHISAGGALQHQEAPGLAMAINIWVTHNYLFMAASYSVVQTAGRVLTTFYQESTFTIPDTPQNTDPVMLPVWAKTGGKRK